MALQLPSSVREIFQRTRPDAETELGSTRPFVRNNAISVLLSALSNRIFDLYVQLRLAIQQTFWDTATGQFLTRPASWFGVAPLEASRGTGLAVLTGVAGSSVPNGHRLIHTTGAQYETTASGVVVDSSLLVTIQRIGLVATVTSPTAHNLSNNVSVTIAGATPNDYNGSQTIRVTGLFTFEYDIAIAAAQPTGSITASFTTVALPVRSITQDEAANLLGLEPLQLGSTLTGVDNALGLDFSGVLGAAADEEQEPFRERFLSQLQNYAVAYNPPHIEALARTVPGVTRAIVLRATPVRGQITVYPLFDNRADPVPTAGELESVRDVLFPNSHAQLSDADLHILAAARSPQDFIFSQLSPNTPSMRAAIRDNLQAYFSDVATPGGVISVDGYRGAISATIDTTTGERVLIYQLSQPTGNIVPESGALPILGSIN